MHPSMSCAEMIASLRANRRAAQDARATAGCASYVAATAPKSSDASSSSSSSRRRARDLDYDPDCPAHNKRQRVRAPQSIALRALQQQSVFHHVMTFAMPSSSLSRTCRDLVLADERLLVQQSDKLISILARFLARWTAPTTGEAANLPLCPHLSFEQLLRASFPIDALMSARVSPHLAHPSRYGIFSSLHVRSSCCALRMDVARNGVDHLRILKMCLQLPSQGSRHRPIHVFHVVSIGRKRWRRPTTAASRV